MGSLGYHEHDALSRFAQRLVDDGVDKQTISQALTCTRQDIIQDPGKDLSSLYTQVAGCRYCSAVSTTPYLPPDWNLDRPLILIVGLRPFRKTQNDKQLVYGLKEAGLRSQNCGYTSVVKCLIEDEKDTHSVTEIINACSTRFLFSEIERISPTVICPIGKTASHTVLGQDEISPGQVYYCGSYTIMPVTGQIFSSQQQQQGTKQFINQMTHAAEIAGL